MASITDLCLLLVTVLYMSNCLQVIPERAEIHYVNVDYVPEATMNVRKASRRGTYIVNLYGELKQIWANNVTFNVIFYELLHNEYKRTFIEFHFAICDMIKSDPFVGKTLANAGITCPVKAGKYYLRNLTITADDFNYVWPFERARAIGTVVHTSTKLVLANGSIYFTFKQAPFQKKKKN